MVSRSVVTLDWKRIDVPTLDSLLASRNGIDTILGLQGQAATTVADLLDRVPLTLLIFLHFDSRTLDTRIA